jgi:hypothetical protein
MRHVLCFCVLLASRGLASGQPVPVTPEPTAPVTPALAPSVSGDPAATTVGPTTSVEDLREEVEDLRSELSDLRERQQARKEPARSNLMNPDITVFLNAAGRVDSRAARSPEGVRLDDRMFLRTAEFEFRAAVDPYADAVAMLAVEDEAGEGFAAEMEEAYVILKRLPIVEAAPLGLKLKLGRFRAPIGAVNRLHLHDLPWTTRPLAIAGFLGTEHGDFFESGYNPVGIDAEFLLPEIIAGAVMELNLEVVDGGAIAISDGGHRVPGFVGHYNLFFTLGDTHDVNLGLSAYYQGGKHRSSLVAADFLYKWKPLRGGEFRSFVLGGEAFHTRRRFALDSDDDGVGDLETKSRAWSAFAFAQVQLSWHLYAGGRYDYAQDIVDRRVNTHAASGYLSYYTSEFLRFRVGYEWRRESLLPDEDRHGVLAEVNVVFGSHPTEPYWVNR